MNSSKEPNGIEALAAFLQGGVRKELGLESVDLRPGLDIAKNHLKKGAMAEAMQTYVALVLCEPMNIDFQVGLANCAVQMQENHLALQAASAIIALAPTDPRGHFLSGRASLGLGFYTEATEDLQKAMELAQQSRDAVIVNEANDLLQKAAALQASAPPP
jgi:tetratricopeptide (TPR) repeat protein